MNNTLPTEKKPSMDETIKQEQTEIAVQETAVTNISNPFADKESFNNLYKVASVLAQSDIVPHNYQRKPADCLIAVDMANRMGISPMMVMQNLYVVKGKPSWSGQACMALVMNCGRYTDVRPVYTGKCGTDSRGCYLQAVSVSDGEIIKGTEITIDMAKKEGWLSNPKWKNMPEQMLAYRAAAFFARVYCPETLMGVQLAEEGMDTEKAAPAVIDPFSKGGEGK